jgi:pantoate--beta-alanine ligase
MVKRNRFTLALVPTMGALHEGHLSLMRAARKTTDKVIVSLFVNPTQFGPSEDLDRYPRQLERDLALASETGADVVFAPSAAEIYPERVMATWVTVEGLSDTLCGAARPGHFRGVVTVVAKLLNLVRPDVAYFGQKDWQQTVVIRRMVRDLCFPVEVRVEPTVREPDGLALSSRNVFLDAAERKEATSLFRGLSSAREAFHAGERGAAALRAKVLTEVEGAPAVRPEYVEVVDASSLVRLEVVSGSAVILVAARVGRVRLIDNVLLGGES